MASTLVQSLKLYNRNSICKCTHAFLRYTSTQVTEFRREINSSAVLRESVRDPAPLFFNSEVQTLLRVLTRVDLKKVFRKRKEGDKLESPVYKFMTTEELNIALQEAEEKANQRLQMPPVVLQRKDINRILSTDPALKGSETAKHVFTDITFGISDRDRIVVVRDPDGTLRDASWEERLRMNQIYFPIQGRKLRIPETFKEERLKEILKEENYEFVLDLACLQFEPDDPDYIRVTTETYDHVDENRKYESLRSTRHFGPLAFYLAWNKRIDNLLLDVIHYDRIEEAVSLIKLYHQLNPGAKSVSGSSTDDLSFIKNYVELDSLKKSTLELAIQTYSELQKQKQEVEAGIQRAHGH